MDIQLSPVTAAPLGAISAAVTRRCEICDNQISVWASHSRAACAARTKRALVDAQIAATALRSENAAQARSIIGLRQEIAELKERLVVYGALGPEDYEVTPVCGGPCECCGLQMAA